MLYSLALFCSLVVASTSGAATFDTRWTNNYNDLVDAVLQKVQKNGAEMGLEPLALPDINREFYVPILFGKLTGEYKNTGGKLTGASAIKRSGDTTLRVDGNTLYIESDLDFVSLNYDYTSQVDFQGLGASGKTYGVISDFVLHLTLKVDLSNPNQAEEQLEDLTIKSTGGLTVHHDSGLGVLDQISNFISDVFTSAFKDVIINSVRPELKTAMESVIQKIENSDTS